jgi:dihydrolipoamide dehydrogenase
VSAVEIKVPDIGDFKNISVIEINAKAGDIVAAEQTLVMLESDKATLDVPAPMAGRILEMKVAIGDKVSEGSVVAVMGPVAAVAAAKPAAPQPAMDHAELLVIGAGPGGYTAAFRAADLGKKVVLVDRGKSLGGVCLNVGCIPSKMLLHAAKTIKDAAEMGAHGVRFGAPAIDLDKLRGWKESVVGRLTGGLAELARRRNVTLVNGEARFAAANMVVVGERTISFEQAIIAAGSEPVRLPFIPHDDPRVIDSTGALALRGIPGRLLVVGGGIIGLEMGTVYEALGSRVTVVELMDQLIPGADKDLVAPLEKRLARQFEKILLGTKVTQVEAREDGLLARFEGPDGAGETLFDQILVAAGRQANGRLLGVEAAGVKVAGNGTIPVDERMRTNIPHIFAVGDVVGQPMLAHKATHEAKVAAEVACGHDAVFAPRVIPSVAYTDPEIAWVGLTETDAKREGIAYDKGVFPWAASGRSLSLGRDEGFTKLLFEKDSRRLLGAGIVGPNAGELIAEAALAIEMGADGDDIGMTIHPHPTVSETVGLAAEAYAGTITDLLPAKASSASLVALTSAMASAGTVKRA